MPPGAYTLMDFVSNSLRFSSSYAMIEHYYVKKKWGYARLGYYLGVSPMTVKNWVRLYNIPPHKPGGPNHIGKKK